MANDIDFINEEKRYWGKVYTDVAYAINEVSPFVSEETSKKRKYFSKSSILQEYIKLLDSAEMDSKKKSLFNMFKSNSGINLVQDFKAKNREDFKQLEKCSKCECLNCTFDCNFKSCSSCRNGSLIVTCDREKFNVRKFDNFNLDLTNNDTGRASKYKVLGLVEDSTSDKQYILLENISNSDDKLVLYYYPGIKEDTFGEITNVEEFDLVIETYQNS